MSSLLDADGFRLVGYLVAALTSLVMFVLESRRRQGTEDEELWPTFWLLQAVLLTTMGLAMAVDAADAVSDAARDRARSDDWYLDRQLLQVPVVGAIVIGWLASTVIAIWRVPPRRRRYLPSAALVGSLVSLAAIRTVSLHQTDTLLYRRELAGIRIVAIVEIALLVAIIAVTAAAARPSRRQDAGGEGGGRRPRPRSTPARTGRLTERGRLNSEGPAGGGVGSDRA